MRGHDISIETSLVKVGQAVTKQLALTWFAGRKADSRRGKDLHRLVRARFPLPDNQRKVFSSLWKTDDDIAARLAPACARAAHGLPDNERDAALDAVADALEDAELSDAALFAVDLSPEALADEVRRQAPIGRAGLSDGATRLYETALDRACIVLVHLVRELPEFNAATAVETLGRLGSLLSTVDEMLARLPERSLDAPSGTDEDELFRRRYFQAMVRAHDRLEVIGLTTHSYEPRTTLSVAYLSLTVSEENDRDGPQRPSRPREDWRGENLRVEAALGEHQRVVLRGEAGAGKSTLLRWLAINAAKGSFAGALGHWNEHVPFLVKLREFADKPLPRVNELLSLPSTPECGPAPDEWAHRQLDSGQALLLVDGVDELQREQRDAVRHWLRGLLSSYPHILVVVTSRPTAVTPKWLAHEGFHSVELESMSLADARELLRRWHKALLDSAPSVDLLPCPPDEIAEHERTLHGQLRSRSHLRALARSPLLCAMLCALNLDRKGQLPRERQALYAAALDMLLERRDADRNVASAGGVRLTRTEKQALLRELAWWLNENGRSQMSWDQAVGRLRARLQSMPNVHEEPEVLLRHLVERSGIVREPAVGRVDFVHRTFQEYLAAEEAVQRDSIDLLVGHARSDLWRETVLMACAHANPEQRGLLLVGLLDEADQATPKTARQLRLLAAACLETVVEVEPAEVITRIIECVRGLVPPRSIRESRSLATVGIRLLDFLPDSLDGLSNAQAAATVRAAVLVNGPEVLPVLAHFARDPRDGVQSELIKGWDYFDTGRYAELVLADAPLERNEQDEDGAVFLTSTDPVSHLHRLRHLRTLYLTAPSDVQIDQEVHLISTMERLRGLHLTAFRAPATLYELARLSRLRQLTFNFSGGLADIDFLTELPQLSDIEIVAGDLGDLGSLRTMKQLEQLSILDGVKLSSIAALGDLPRLRHLTLWHCLIRDLSPLADIPTLTSLLLGNCPQPVDLRPLADCQMRIVLDSGTAVTGVSELGDGVHVFGRTGERIYADWP
ncbi:NACHT domain-containing protein [Solihabitans fulvus]|uniref:NACHT domain-containing protein n=1 Tax=Solihabitans fulvus TaxID=1892852 RepID=A0A5B2XE53_9PSEU|nr:NACHT domain-containing protein [Solihabitans fulvus]KAA2261241.1 NACHT domain-containing protein [Solihabitans fulvus]